MQPSLALKQTQSHRLSMSMWLPLLHASLDELDGLVNEIGQDNPYVETEETYLGRIHKTALHVNNSSTDAIEALSIAKASLYETLLDQIEPPLFPTPISQEVAKEIIHWVSDEGYFEGDMKEIAKAFGLTLEACEKIRARFSQLEPLGVGARDLKESFLFQLEAQELDDELYGLVRDMILQFETIESFSTHPRFQEAKRQLQHFKNPPAIEYLAQSPVIVPDVLVFSKEGTLSVQVNGKFYPQVTLKKVEGTMKHKYKEAKELVNLLELRKATLYKLTIVLIERQQRYFYGGHMVPLTMQEVADELGFNESTISRAVANKYLWCDRGIVPFKDFFAAALTPTLTSGEVKAFIEEVIRHEPKTAPFSDEVLLSRVQARFGIALVRRSITKYRLELGIGSSNERKRLYRLE
jgi:RNA polymerase sigma-54 factor